MTNYIITNEAVDEAAEAIRVGIDRRSIWDLAKAAVEAAAPFIRAQALEDAADEGWKAMLVVASRKQMVPGADDLRDWLRARAATEVAS